MGRRIAALGGVLAVALIALGIAVFNGGGGQEGTSREDYRRARVRFDERVDRALADLERVTVLRSARGLPVERDARSGGEIQAALQGLRAALRAEMDGLARVEPPQDAGSAHRQLARSARGVAELAGRLARSRRLTELKVENALARSPAWGTLERAGDELDARGYLSEPGTGARPPPPAAVRDCRLRAEGRPFTPDRERDTIIGPIAFTGLPALYRDYASRSDSELEHAMTGMKSIALVSAGARVTLAVPPDQRRWMRLIYWQGYRRRVEPLALQACRLLSSRRAQRRECRWGGRSPWSAANWACRLPYTQFSGGFGLDFRNAPRRGLCAELIVWIKGERRPLRGRLFRPRPGECKPPGG